jgi:hypothetical protein
VSSAKRGQHKGTWALLALPLVAGCGGAFNAQPGALRVDAAARTVRTGEQLRLSATAVESGDPAPVQWRITGSDNATALGPGSISSDGVYTPPGMLSRDVVTISITAGTSDSAPVTTTLSVVPGFVQPLQPENATLTPGSSIQVRAQLAEVGSGSVVWTLENAAGSTGDSAALGSLSAQHCERSPQQFTTCTVTYTAAPNTLTGAPVWLMARTRASGSSAVPGISVRARLLTGEILSNPALHQMEQAGAIALGGSGGSDNDFDTYKDRTGKRYVADCCGGTLGALVEDTSGTPYILSNNHVLATSDQGRMGDTIEQPGLIDDGCVPLSQAGSRVQAVGALRYAVPLNAPGTNVDAALASVDPGTVDASGSILELGAPGGEATLRSGAPVAGLGEMLDAARLDGLSVVKSGRTTGLTCSTVDAVDLRVTVDYYKDCAETQPYTTRTFTRQIGVGGEAFADSGDSGSLVLDAANARAVGLLYATGTAGASGAGLTLVNPIGDVLSELSAETGSALTLRGTSTPHSIACLNYDAARARPALSTLAPDERARVTQAVEAAATLRSARVLAVGPGVSADDPGRGAVLVYVDRAQPSVTVPGTIAGVRTVVVPADPEAMNGGPAAWPAATITPGIRLSAGALASARTIAERLGPQIMQAPAVFGVGVTQSLDSPEEAALLVLVDSDASRLETARVLQQLNSPTDAETAGLPATLGGLRVRYLTMHRLRVTQSKYVARGGTSSCALRSLAHPEAGDGERPWSVERFPTR